MNAEKCSQIMEQKKLKHFLSENFLTMILFCAISHSALINVKTIFLHRLLSYARVRELKKWKNSEFKTTETTVIKIAAVNDATNLYSSQLITLTINLNRYHLQSAVTLLISNFILIASRYFLFKWLEIWINWRLLCNNCITADMIFYLDRLSLKMLFFSFHFESGG